MAITVVNPGSTISSATSINVPLPAGVAAGDLLVLVIGSAQSENAIPAAEAGWTYAGTGTSTFEAFGTNTGPRSLTFYYRVFGGTETGVLVTQTGGTGATISGVMIALRKGSTETWGVANAVFGEDAVAGTAVAVTTTGTPPGIDSGDYVVGAFVNPKNATASAQAVAATGATLAASVERSDTTNAPGVGYRVSLTSWTQAVTAGSSAVAPTLSLTSSASTTYGEGGVLRIRATPGGSITAAYDANNDRIGVTLSSWIADEETTIYRVHADGSRVEVRGGAPVKTSGGAAFVWDYEFPTNENLTYVALDSGMERTSNTVTVTDARSWLRAPGLPGLDITVRLGNLPDRSHARPITYLTPIGRRTTVPVYDARKAPTFPLQVVCLTDAESDALLALLDGSASAWLLWPGTKHHATYVSLGNAVEHPVTGKVGMTESVWTIEASEVARPAGAIAFDPTASWQAILDTSASWSAVAAGYTSWLDVLAGPEG